MNASQLLAWIICLALAFFASALAARNGWKTAVLEKQFAAVQETAQERQEVLEEIRDVLQSIDRQMAAQGDAPSMDQASATLAVPDTMVSAPAG
jgi:hypothetical protein